MIEVRSARHAMKDGQPVLVLDLGGRRAVLGFDAHPDLHRAKWVFVGAQFADLLPERTVKVPGGGDCTLAGLTDDPTVWQLYDDFLKAAGGEGFAPGPVQVPS